MKKEILINADKWCQLHDITSFIHPKKDTIYINIGNFELELSKDEIEYRASEYIRLKELEEKNKCEPLLYSELNNLNK